MKPIWVAVGAIGLVASFLIPHWTSWLLLIASVGVLTFGIASKR